MRVLGGILATALVLAAGCGDDDGEAVDAEIEQAAGVETTTTVAARAEVEHLTLDLVDPTRPTPAGAGLPGSDQRQLVTEVYVPAGSGPYPFVAFAHGLAGHPRKFTQLHEAWAEAGYLVAAPAFPLSNDEVPGEPTFTDLANQPGDISFVIDEVLAASEDGTHPLFGTVDPERIAVAGLSLGGATTYGVAFNDCCRDGRPIAAMVLDGARLAVGGEYQMDSGLPLLIVHADEDYTLPYEEAEHAYAAAVGPKYLVTLHEAAHAEPFEDTPDPADDLVLEVTTAFWDRWLGGDAEADERLTGAVQAAGALASIEHVPGDDGG